MVFFKKIVLKKQWVTNGFRGYYVMVWLFGGTVGPNLVILYGPEKIAQYFSIICLQCRSKINEFTVDL